MANPRWQATRQLGSRSKPPNTRPRPSARRIPIQAPTVLDSARLAREAESAKAGAHGWFLCRLTFELSWHRRWDARARLAKMYTVPPTGPAWPAVGAQLERGVRLHCGAARTKHGRPEAISAGLAMARRSWGGGDGDSPAARAGAERSHRRSSGGGFEELTFKPDHSFGVCTPGSTCAP